MITSNMNKYDQDTPIASYVPGVCKSYNLNNCKTYVYSQI